MHHLIPAPRLHHPEGDPDARLTLGPDTALRTGQGTGTAARWLRTTVGGATGLALPEAADGHPGPVVDLRIPGGRAGWAPRRTGSPSPPTGC